MDITSLAKFCGWISERVEETFPGRFWWITVIAGTLALLGLGLMLFGLRLVRGLCLLLGAPAGAVLGLLLAPAFGGSALLYVAVGAGAGLFLGLVFYRVMVAVLAVQMLLTVLALGAGWNVAEQVDWEYLLGREPKITTTRFINPHPHEDKNKNPFQIFGQRLKEEYQNIVQNHPQLPWVTGGAAVLLLLAGMAGVVWLWRWTALAVSLFFGVQLVLVGGGVFLLRVDAETFDQVFAHPTAFLIGLLLLTFLCGLGQYRLNRRPAYSRPVGESAPVRAGGWAL